MSHGRGACPRMPGGGRVGKMTAIEMAPDPRGILSRENIFPESML